MTILKTERLTLRPLELSDAARVSELAGAPEVARMMARIPSPYPPIAAEGYILLTLASAAAHGEVHFAVELPGEGIIGAVWAKPETGGTEISFWIGAAYWGRGYGREAILALIKHLGPCPLIATVYTDNPASLRLLSALGFSDTGARRRGYCFGRRTVADYVVLQRAESGAGNGHSQAA